MIPKKIHYCWFGRGEKPTLAQKCIDSWKQFCPDYEIIEWNEDNFDIHFDRYTQMCYEQKKYAFLSDYVRLLVINEHGGLYFDTDVEAVKSFDSLLTHRAFFGFETDDYINTGEGFGSEAGAEVLRLMIAEYDDLLDGNHGTEGCPILNTRALKRVGLMTDGSFQLLQDGVAVYPKDYFNPFDDATGVLTKTENTYSIHWYGKSWMDKRTVWRNKCTRVLHRFFGKELFKR